jgi:hypothetical protein
MATETVETVKTRDGKILEVHTINGVTMALTAKDAAEVKKINKWSTRRINRLDVLG